MLFQVLYSNDEFKLSLIHTIPDLANTILACLNNLIVKLRSRSRLGEGQVKVRRVRFGPELYHIFGFAYRHQLPHKL